MGSEKLTKAQHKALLWADAAEPVRWLRGSPGYPRLATLHHLMAAGLVNQIKPLWKCQFIISLEGRSALSTTTKGEGDE